MSPALTSNFGSNMFFNNMSKNIIPEQPEQFTALYHDQLHTKNARTRSSSNSSSSNNSCSKNSNNNACHNITNINYQN